MPRCGKLGIQINNGEVRLFRFHSLLLDNLWRLGRKLLDFLQIRWGNYDRVGMLNSFGIISVHRGLGSPMLSNNLPLHRMLSINNCLLLGWRRRSLRPTMVLDHFLNFCRCLLVSFLECLDALLPELRNRHPSIVNWGSGFLLAHFIL